MSCTCIELNDEDEDYNCTCSTKEPCHATEGHYLDCLNALRKGKRESGVYSLKPDSLPPFKVLFMIYDYTFENL